MTSSPVGQLHLLPIRQTQSEFGPERLVFIHARLTAAIPWAVAKAEQWDAAGLYEAWVPSCLTNAQAASCAMSAFFAEVAAELSSFDFRVFDGATGQVLSCDPRLPPGALADACSSVKLVGHLG